MTLVTMILVALALAEIGARFVVRGAAPLQAAAAKGDEEAKRLLAEDPVFHPGSPVIATGPWWAAAMVLVVASRLWG